MSLKKIDDSIIKKLISYGKLQRSRRLINKSNYFDKEWYLNEYRDVRQSGIDVATHYLLHGGFEGRDPGPNFSSIWYLDTYPEVREIGINPLLHYERFGKKEGKIPNNSKNLSYKDIQTNLSQLESIINLESDLPLPPPKHLQVRVVGQYSSNFIESGYKSVYPTLVKVLEPVGKNLGSFQSILDYGCGCGRATRALARLLPDSKLYGTDIDPEAIEWLNKNYRQFAEFSVAPLIPPTVYPDNMFDLIFGISVLTHLPEAMQFDWLEELRRITKPGGYVILSIHGEKHFKKMGDEVNQVMSEKGFYYHMQDSYNYGKSVNLPDFYQNAYHSKKYIRREWGKYFDVLDIQALLFDNHQDSVLLQK